MWKQAPVMISNTLCVFLFAHSHNISQLSVCVAFSNHGHYPSLKHFIQWRKTNLVSSSTERILPFSLCFLHKLRKCLLSSIVQARENRPHKEGDLVKIQGRISRGSSIGAGSWRKDSLRGICHIRTQFFPWKGVPWKFIQGSKGKVMILTSTCGVIHAEFPTHK